MKYGEDQRQRPNVTAARSPANKELQKERLQCLEFYFLSSGILIITGNFNFECPPMNAGSFLRISMVWLGEQYEG